LPAGRAHAAQQVDVLLHRVSAIITALPIIVTFTSAMPRMAHEYSVAILYIVALVFFILSLVDLTREPRIALHDFDHHL
jgi:hypothetical protein